MPAANPASAVQSAVRERVLARVKGRDLRKLILNKGTRLTGVAALLDSMTPEDRIRAVRGLDRTAQKRLWDMAEGSLAKLNDFVPVGTPTLQLVRHYGKNTLPVHTYFEKRFALAPDHGPNGRIEMWGFNFQTLMHITGPGYYVAYEDPATGSVGIDYRLIPSRQPEGPGGWPKLDNNDHGLAQFIYGGMVDHMRKVSSNVTIGRAFKGGKWLPAWFVLTREDIDL
jgi:hypothetical protein